MKNKLLLNFVKKLFLSRKGISWLISQYLIICQFRLMRLKILSRVAITIYDLGILTILYIASLAFLGLIVFEKIKIHFDYGKEK